MTVSHTDCYYAGNQVKVSLALMVKQPLHVTLEERKEGDTQGGNMGVGGM